MKGRGGKGRECVDAWLAWRATEVTPEIPYGVYPRTALRGSETPGISPTSLSYDLSRSPGPLMPGHLAEHSAVDRGQLQTETEEAASGWGSNNFRRTGPGVRGAASQDTQRRGLSACRCIRVH